MREGARVSRMALLRGALLALVGAATAAATPALADPAAPPERVDPEAARMRPLSTAELDDTLAIGGTEIDARKLASRMTVQVRVNGTGPYKFVVDSGADTSVVGEPPVN